MVWNFLNVQLYNSISEFSFKTLDNVVFRVPHRQKNLKRRFKIEQSRYELNTIFNLKFGNEFDFLRTIVWYAFYEHLIKEKTFIYYSDGSSAYYFLVHHGRVLFSAASGVLRKKWEVCCFNFFLSLGVFGSIFSNTMTQNAANIVE